MRKVIGIGETVFDIIFRSEQPVAATPGGSTYNSILSLGRSGVPAEFISETGDDRVGRRIAGFLEENGVSSRSVFIHKGQKSALSLAFLNEKNDAEYVFYKDHSRDQLDFDLPDVHADDVVIFGSFYAINPIVRHQVKSFLDYASDRGAILYYDVNFRSSHRDDIPQVMDNIRENLSLADVVRGSHEDFDILFGKTNINEIYHHEILPYSRNFIYTRGAEPLEIRGANGLEKQYPVPSVKTVSTIGAGDSFNAGFVYGMIRHDLTGNQIREGLSERDWDELVKWGQAFSSNVCQSVDNYIDISFGNELRSCRGVPQNASKRA